MNRTYNLHDETVKSLIALVEDEANRAEILDDNQRKEQLLADLGALEAQLPQEAWQFEAVEQ